MDAATTRARILGVLQGIAPEADVRALRAERPLGEQIDLDSLDWLSLADRVGKDLGVPMSTSRLGPASTLDDWVRAAQAAQQRQRRRQQRAGLPAAGDATSPDGPKAASGGGAAAVPRVDGTGRPAAAVHRLADGRRVRLRPVVAADAPLLAGLVRGLSPTSRYRRFMVSLRELPADKLKTLTAVDQRRHIALAATEVGSGRRAWIGVARCVADAEGDGCEFALMVADDWQGSGLAGLLMRALMQAARAAGRRSMHGEVLASNGPMRTLARQLGFTARRQAGDSGSLWVHATL